MNIVAGLLVEGIIRLILAVVLFLPTIITKWRASVLGLNLTWAQANQVTKGFTNKSDFLRDVKDIWFWAEIPIDKLIFHYHAKGDLKNLRDGIIEMKQRNRAVDFNLLAAIDLAGRDLKTEIKKAELNNWTFSLAD
jgi:hypothetical protein